MMRADSIMFFWVYFSDLLQSKRRMPGTVSKVAVRGNFMSLALASFWEPVTSAQHWLAYQPGPLALWILIEYWYRQNTAVGFSCLLNPPLSLLPLQDLTPPTPLPSLPLSMCLCSPPFFFHLIKNLTRLMLCISVLLPLLIFKWIINQAKTTGVINGRITRRGFYDLWLMVDMRLFNPPPSSPPPPHTHTHTHTHARTYRYTHMHRHFCHSCCIRHYACIFMWTFLQSGESAMNKLGAPPTIFIHVSATAVMPTSSGMTPQVLQTSSCYDLTNVGFLSQACFGSNKVVVKRLG